MIHKLIIQFLLFIILSVVIRSANSGDNEKSENTTKTVTSEQQAQKNNSEKSFQNSKAKKRRSNFIPSEKIKADTAVPFPVDI